MAVNVHHTGGQFLRVYNGATRIDGWRRRFDSNTNLKGRWRGTLFKNFIKHKTESIITNGDGVTTMLVR